VDNNFFLHSHGVSTSRAVRIFKAEDIHGIGFKSADIVAQKL
jgi:hypothetical protein